MVCSFPHFPRVFIIYILFFIHWVDNLPLATGHWTTGNYVWISRRGISQDVVIWAFGFFPLEVNECLCGCGHLWNYLCGRWPWTDVEWPKGWTVVDIYWLLLCTHVPSHINSTQIFFEATTPPCSPWTLWAVLAASYEWLEPVSAFFSSDYSYFSRYGHCVLGWSHQVHFRNLTWNDWTLSTTGCEWGNMGLQTLLAVILWLQGEQTLGWGHHCEWQSREEEGWWALHYTLEHLNQPATRPAFLLDCPL